MRISDWSSDVCSTDLQDRHADEEAELRRIEAEVALDADTDDGEDRPDHEACRQRDRAHDERRFARSRVQRLCYRHGHCPSRFGSLLPAPQMRSTAHPRRPSMKSEHKASNSAEHKSELQTIMRNS